MRFFTIFGSGTGTIQISGPAPAGSTIGTGQSAGGSVVLGGLEAVAAHVAHRGAPPVGQRLVVAGVEAEVLEAGGCVSHEAAG